MSNPTRKNIELYDEVSSLVGNFIASVATFELELDDLFALAGSQIEGLFSDVPAYPVQISDKIKRLPKIAASINEPWEDEAFLAKCEGILELRNILVHGKISSAKQVSSGFTLVVHKMGLPKKTDGRQLLQRTTFDVASIRIVDAIFALSDLEEIVENLTKAVFGLGDGWPDYIVMPSEKPFGASILTSEINSSGFWGGQ